MVTKCNKYLGIITELKKQIKLNGNDWWKKEKIRLEKVTTDKTYKKPIKSVAMVGKVWSLSDNLKQLVTTDFNIELEGQIKKPTISVRNSYCQFCGESLDEK